MRVRGCLGHSSRLYRDSSAAKTSFKFTPKVVADWAHQVGGNMLLGRPQPWMLLQQSMWRHRRRVVSACEVAGSKTVHVEVSVAKLPVADISFEDALDMNYAA